MDFNESGLPDTPLIQRAFEFSHNFIMGGYDDLFQDYKEQIEDSHQQGFYDLDLALQQGNISVAEYEAKKAELKEEIEGHLQQLPEYVQAELKDDFAKKCVGAAKEVMNSDNPAEALIAAGLLVNCGVSPIDHQNIEQEFESAISGIIAEIFHLEAYPDEHKVLLSLASKDTKRVYLAARVSAMNNMIDQVSRIIEALAAQGETVDLKLPWPEVEAYEHARAFWGIDQKLETRFIDVFNRIGTLAQSPYELKLDKKGNLVLKKYLDQLNKVKGAKGYGKKIF